MFNIHCFRSDDALRCRFISHDG